MRSTRKPFTRVEKLVVAAFAVSVVIAALIPCAFWLTNDRQRERDAEALEGRRIESCRAYNVDQTNDRNTAIEGLRKFAIVFLGVTEAEADEELASENGREFVAFIDSENPYRTCTPACVEAEFNADLPNCGPSDNEKGTP